MSSISTTTTTRDSGVSGDSGSRTFAVPDGKLDIRAISTDGQIDVLVSDRDDVLVSWTKSGDSTSPLWSKLRLLVEQRGNEIDIRPDGFGDWAWDSLHQIRNLHGFIEKAAQAIADMASGGFDGFGGHWVRFDIVIELPRETPKLQLQLHTASGSLSVDGVRIKRLVANSASGDIDIRGSNLDATVHAVSGSLVVDDCTGPLELRSVSGDIRVMQPRSPRLRIDSVSGDVALALSSEDAGLHELKSVSGDFAIAIPANAVARGVTISLNSVSGEVKASDPFRRTGDNEWQSGTGRQTSIRAQTISGDVVVREQAAFATEEPSEKRPSRNATPEQQTPVRIRAAEELVQPDPGGVNDKVVVLGNTEQANPTIRVVNPTPMAVAPSTSEERRRAILERVEQGELDIDEALQMLDRV